MQKLSLFLATKKIEKIEFDCELHGFVSGYKNALTLEPVCSHCIDDTLRKERLNQFEELLEHRLKISSIPKRYMNTAFERKTQHQKDFVKQARLWSSKLKKEQWSSLHLTGPVGVGKTLLACRIAINIIQNGWNVKYISSTQACDEVKSSYKKEFEDDVLYRLINNYDLLVLDEIDTVINSDHDKALIHKLIRGRYEQMKPIVTISNNKIDALKEKLGDRAVSALYENITIIEMYGNDYRLSANDRGDVKL